MSLLTERRSSRRHFVAINIRLLTEPAQLTPKELLIHGNEDRFLTLRAHDFVPPSTCKCAQVAVLKHSLGRTFASDTDHRAAQLFSGDHCSGRNRLQQWP